MNNTPARLSTNPSRFLSFILMDITGLARSICADSKIFIVLPVYHARVIKEIYC